MGCKGSVETKEDATQTGRDRRPSFGQAFLPDEGSEALVVPKRRHVTHVCLTGGPCAGKSTALSLLQTKLLQKAGVKVFCVPEAATLMVGGGMDWGDATTADIRIEYQLALLRCQIGLEDTFLDIARAYGKPAVVVSDRGTMDGRAFCSEEEFAEVLRRGCYTLEQLRDARYDAVLHMVTAAKGAEKFYNFDNPARYETKEEARERDEKLQSVYIGHRNVKLFDNSQDFDGKLGKVFDAVLAACGHVTVPHHRTRRYFTAVPVESEITVPFAKMTVTATVLAGSTSEDCKLLMRRTEGLTTVYIYQHTYQKNGNVIREEHRISPREYQGLLLQRDTSREDVVKKNISFMYEDNYYESGVFVTPEAYVGKAMMYVDCSENQNLPPFIHDAKDVTSDAAYSTLSMSVRPKKQNGSVASANATPQRSPSREKEKEKKNTASDKL